MRVLIITAIILIGMAFVSCVGRSNLPDPIFVPVEMAEIPEMVSPIPGMEDIDDAGLGSEETPYR